MPISDLLTLRTEEEWEEVRRRIGALPQDDALSAELNKVPAASTFSLLFPTLASSRKELATDCFISFQKESSYLQMGVGGIFFEMGWGMGCIFQNKRGHITSIKL